MNDRRKGAAMPDRSAVEAALARVAVAAFTYYPDKAIEEPGYVIEEDVDWAMEPLGVLDTAERDEWRQRFALVIADRAGDRRTFIADLTALGTE